MPLRILFGPLASEFAEFNQRHPPPGSDSLTFDASGRADLCIGPEDTWEQVQQKFPPGWHPDAVLLYLPYTWVPKWLWSAPVPLIGWATDWNLLWHGYR